MVASLAVQAADRVLRLLRQHLLDQPERAEVLPAALPLLLAGLLLAERRLVGRRAGRTGGLAGRMRRLAASGIGRMRRRPAALPRTGIAGPQAGLEARRSVFRLSGTAGLFVPAGLSAVTAPVVAMSVAVRERPAIVCAHHTPSPFMRPAVNRVRASEAGHFDIVTVTTIF